MTFTLLKTIDPILMKFILSCILAFNTAFISFAKPARTAEERREVGFRMIDRQFDQSLIVFLADVRVEGRNWFVTPREQFKGEGLTLGRDIRLDFFKEETGDKIMDQRIFYFPFYPNHDTWMSTVIEDGKMRRVPEISLDEIREHFATRQTGD